MSFYKKNYERIKQIVDTNKVQIIAVSKYSMAEDVRNFFFDTKLNIFAENKVQDLKQKKFLLKDLDLNWHFIGNLQRNKINHLIDLDPFLMQSLSSLKLADALNLRLGVKNKSMDCLLEVNSSYEDSKSGVDPKNVLDVYHKIEDEYTNINLKGLMCIGSNDNKEYNINKSFELTYELYSKLNNATICSMGMSNDYEIAIKRGSNMIRIGSALFN